MKSQSQNERLLQHLERVGPIDPLQAWSKLGIYRLGARVFDLKEAGHNIVRSMIDVNNRFGEKCRVALYSLVLNEKA